MYRLGRLLPTLRTRTQALPAVLGTRRSLNYILGGHQDQETMEEYTVKALTYEMELYQRKSAERTVPWFLKNMPPQYFKEIDTDLQKDHLRALTALTEAGLAQYEEDEAQKLCEMAAKGDIGKIKQLINMGAHPNTGDYDGRTPFHLAASEGNMEVLKFLASVKGANINVVDRWGGTPLADAIRHGHDNVIRWLKSKGGLESISSNTAEQQELQQQEKVARAAHRTSGSLVELMLKSRTGKYITFFKPHDKDSCGDFREMVNSLPMEQDLGRVKGFVTKDQSMLCNVFEFGDPEYPEGTEFYAGKLLEAVEQLNNGTFKSAEPVPQSEIYTSENIHEFVKCCPIQYLENTPVDRVLRHMAMWDNTKGTDNVQVTVRKAPAEDGNDNLYWCTNISSDVHPHSELVRVSSYLTAKGMKLNRIHLDRLKDPMGGEKSLIRTLFEPRDPLGDDLVDIMKTEMTRLKYLDDAVIGWATNADISYLQAEVCMTLGNLVFSIVNKEHPYAYTLDRVMRILQNPEHHSICVNIANLFLDKFNPDGPSASSETAARADSIRKDIYATVQGNIVQHLLVKLVQAVEMSQRTNAYLPNRMTLTVKVQPQLLLFGDQEQPYGVFFNHGRRMNGFHCRFRDIARGGLRVVPTDGYERFGQEAMRHFDEVYGLSFAQQLKNKDIPEGGSKAVCLVNVSDRTPGARDFIIRKSVKCFTDGLLDMITPCPETRKLLVDYYGQDELLYLGPDENIIPEDINWVTDRAAVRKMQFPNAFMSSKPDAGINHKVYGVTSEGVAVFLQVALENSGIDTAKDDWTVKITGGPNGDVAGNMIKILRRDYDGRAKIVAMVDHTGGVEDPSGLDMEELYRLHVEDLPIGDYSDDVMAQSSTGKKYLADSSEGLLLRNTMHNRVEADAFIPAGGRPNTININNWNKFLKDDGTPSSPLIVEAANIFTTPEARKELGKCGVSIVKDSSANKCGVMCSSYEIVASMLIDKHEFINAKQEIVDGVLEILRSKARTEAELLFREYRSNPANQLPSYSQTISECINRASDAVINAMTENFDLLPEEIRRRLVIESIPQKLVEVAGDRLANLPKSYVISMMGACLGSRMVYNEGIEYIDSLSDEALTDFAMRYVFEQDKITAFVDELENSDLASKAQIAKILKASGVRSVLASGL